MAATIGATATAKVIRGVEFDVFDESITKTVELDGAITDAAIEEFIDDYQQVSNTGFRKMSVQSAFDVTGLDATPENELLPNLSAVMQFTFSHVNLINPSKPGRRLLKIRAPKDDIYQLSGDPIDGIVPDANDAGTGVVNALNRIIGKLESSMLFRPTETDPVVVGGWEYEGGRLLTETRVMDGDSLT